jgi:hypothetical protein
MGMQTSTLAAIVEVAIQCYDARWANGDGINEK